MQTFLPYPDFAQSAQCLDYRRLGKQRVECMQILKALTYGGGWANHPATKMWQGYEPALQAYMYECIKEWIGRGYKNTILVQAPTALIMPHWFGDISFHASHRSNLLRKDASYYSQFNWSEPNNLPYVWPV